MTHDEAWEDVGFAADSLDNLIHAMALPMPADFHLRQLRVSLPVIRDRLRADFVAATGGNPWKTHGLPGGADGAGEVEEVCRWQAQDWPQRQDEPRMTECGHEITFNLAGDGEPCPACGGRIVEATDGD